MKLSEKIKSIPERLVVMSPRKLVLLAFVLSVIVAGFIYVILTGFLAPKPAPTTKAPQYVNVVVASRDIADRTRLTGDMLKTVRVTSDVVPATAMHSVEEAVGRSTTQKIMKDDIVTIDKLAGGRGGLASNIPADSRAITIPINDVTGVSGLLKPGDYVDIFLVSSKSYKNAIYGKLVLQNVLLLAINTNVGVPTAQQTNGDAKDQQGKQQQQANGKAATVTIAVNPTDVLRVEAAMQEGTLYLALRPDIADESYTVIPDYFQYMAGGDEQKPQAQQQQAAAPAAQPRQPAPYVPAAGQGTAGAGSGSNGGGGGGIEVIRGNSVSRVNVN